MQCRIGLRHETKPKPLVGDKLLPTNTKYYSEVWIPSYGAKPAITAEASCYTR